MFTEIIEPALRVGALYCRAVTLKLKSLRKKKNHSLNFRILVKISRFL